MENYYIYYYCDQWKMRDSMILVGVFTEEKLKRVIIDDLMKDNIKLDNRRAQEISNMILNTINCLIEYGHIDEITLNERC